MSVPATRRRRPRALAAPAGGDHVGSAAAMGMAKRYCSQKLGIAKSSGPPIALACTFSVAAELDLFAQNERDVEYLRASPDHELNLSTRRFGTQALTRIRKPRVGRRTAI